MSCDKYGFFIPSSLFHSIRPYSLRFGFRVVSITIYVTGGTNELPTSQWNHIHNFIVCYHWSYGLLIYYFHINVYNFCITAGTLRRYKQDVHRSLLRVRQCPLPFSSARSQCDWSAIEFEECEYDARGTSDAGVH